MNKKEKARADKIYVMMISEQVGEVISDIINQKFPDEGPLTAIFTIGQFRAVRGFWTIDWMVREIVASFCGRMVRASVQSMGFDPCTPIGLAMGVEVLHATSHLDDEIVAKVMSAARAKHPIKDEEIPVELAKQMFVKFTAVVAAINGDQSSDGTIH